MHFGCVGGFDNDGGVGEPWVVDKAPEGGFADFTIAEVVVAIYPGADGLLAVVTVDDFNAITPDQTVEFGECGFVGVGSANVVPGGEDVASIEANCEVVGVASEVKDLGEMLEFIVEG